MLRFATAKLARAAFTMWLVVTFVFFALRLTGDPAEQLLPDQATQEMIDFYRARWGLDRPLWEQYVAYWQALLHGDFGISFRNSEPVFKLIVDRIPKTALLGGLATLFAIGVGIPLGIYAALRRGGLADRFTMSFAIFGFSMPNFFLGIILILIFSMHLRILPSSGSGSWLHYVMPVFTLGTALAGQLARFTRSAMMEVLDRPYIRTAASKGASRRRIVLAHAWPNTAVPIVTIVGLKVGDILGGAVITETVFAWPGVGRLLTVAVADRDVALVQGILMLVAFTMVATNVLVDLIYGWLDPRVRVGRRQQNR